MEGVWPPAHLGGRAGLGLAVLRSGGLASEVTVIFNVYEKEFPVAQSVK